MRNFKLPQNPYLLFSPLLILFMVIVFKKHSDVVENDAIRYVYFAKNLLHGFYSPPAPDINLWNGPGYPILLMPFIALRLPLICITLMNAIFQYLSVVLLFKAIVQIVDYKRALVFSLFWAFCYSSYDTMALIFTESFTAFLISLLIFSLVNAFNNQIKKYIYLSGFIFGYIVLTKVIFGYVLIFMLSGSILLWMKNRKIQNYRRGAFIMLIAFGTTMPYLFYTYNLTGRLLYWGTSGGASLYWMSNPNEYEYGFCDYETLTVVNHGELDMAGTALLKFNHQKDIDEVKKLKGVYKDDAYKILAINNIKAHPKKFIKNIISNISRTLFGFPYDYSYQTPLLRIWYFSLLYSLMVFCVVPTIINWREIPYCLRFLFVFAFIYLGGISLLSSLTRYLVIIIPVLMFWIAYIIDKSLIFKIKFEKDV